MYILLLLIITQLIHFYIVRLTNFKNSVSEIDKAVSKRMGHVPLNLPLFGLGGRGCKSFTNIHVVVRVVPYDVVYL